jgi:hypothetical protein
MNAKSSANTMPLVRENKTERAGEHILFNARTRSKLAKQGGDALSDLAQRDVDRAGRYPVPAEIGTGGELVPGEPDLRDTVKNPDYVTLDANRDRLALASGAGVLEMALDACDTIDSKNSLEKMLVHRGGSTSTDNEALHPDGGPLDNSVRRVSTEKRGSLPSWWHGGPASGRLSGWLPCLATGSIDDAIGSNITTPESGRGADIGGCRIRAKNRPPTA